MSDQMIQHSTRSDPWADKIGRSVSLTIRPKTSIAGILNSVRRYEVEVQTRGGPAIVRRSSIIVAKFGRRDTPEVGHER